MSKHWNPGKKTVELRPSRIRRDPAPAERKTLVRSNELQMWGGVTGITLLAIAITALVLGISAATIQLFAGGADAQIERFGSCDGGPNCVIDGNTIRIAGETVKVAGMEAPEIQSARCPEEEQRGVKAVQRLAELLNSGKVTTAEDVREPDGQRRRRVLVDGRDVGAAMVSMGLAREYDGTKKNWCS